MAPMTVAINTSLWDIVWAILLACILAWFFTMTAGALFAFITFRTKRESHEPLFSKGLPAKGDAFVLDEFAEEPSGRTARMPFGSEAQERDAAADLMSKQTARFLEQLSMDVEAIKANEAEHNATKTKETLDVNKTDL
ncbi:MAG: hypothetical protein A4E65_00788 [Syntrophorhabdus sp. PtaU1.Bin153]|nr:MAG: hypothetical protein A4E65_00788 [Syntrophorhabdus sp. PtaU1.Bin153]